MKKRMKMKYRNRDSDEFSKFFENIIVIERKEKEEEEDKADILCFNKIPGAEKKRCLKLETQF